MVKGLKNAYLMHFPSLHSWFRRSVCFYLKCSSSHNQRVIQRVKKHFFCQNLFQIMYDKKTEVKCTPQKKNKNQLTVRGEGGGSTLTVSLTVRYPVFFMTSLIVFVKDSQEAASFRRGGRGVVALSPTKLHVAHFPIIGATAWTRISA